MARIAAALNLMCNYFIAILYYVGQDTLWDLMEALYLKSALFYHQKV